MNKKLFNEEQIKNLLKNPNVIKCDCKNITYSSSFKKLAVKLYIENGLSASLIFSEAGFNPDIIGKYRSKSCLRDWLGIYKIKGLEGFEHNNKNKQYKIGNKIETDRIKRLEAENAYLRAENDFLIKLRAGQAE